MITAMAVGELEIGNLAYSTLGLAIQNAGLDDLEVIGMGAPMSACGTVPYVCSWRKLTFAPGPSTQVIDLAGRTVTSTSLTRGSSAKLSWMRPTLEGALNRFGEPSVCRPSFLPVLTDEKLSVTVWSA